jgi:hypothetical protein
MPAGVTSQNVALGPEGGDYRLIAVGEAGRMIGLPPPSQTGWTAITSPTTRTLFALARGPGGRLYAMGESGTVISYDGTQWSSVSSPTLKTLRSAWSDGNAIFVVGGTQSGGAIILRYGAP